MAGAVDDSTIHIVVVIIIIINAGDIMSAMQFGFVTLFVAVCPLAPFIAVVNNAVELRADANKFVSRYRRPTATRASNIGLAFSLSLSLSDLRV